MQNKNTVLVCPERDGICPHGLECPFAINRYTCNIEASRRELAMKKKARDDAKAAK